MDKITAVLNRLNNAVDIKQPYQQVSSKYKRLQDKVNLYSKQDDQQVSNSFIQVIQQP